jgi:hypothetical protein
VSSSEKEIIGGLVNVPVNVVGHSLSRVGQQLSEQPVSARTGFLIVGDFAASMYYNADAAWFWLTHVLPRVAQHRSTLQSGSLPTLTIAGRRIPQPLIATVQASPFNERIRLVESPESTHALYNAARVVVIPHQYAAGTMFKFSEAMASGVPVGGEQHSCSRHRTGWREP